MSPIEPPDVMALLLDYLPPLLGVPVVSRRLDKGTFVWLRNTGGPGRHRRILQTVQITANVYGVSGGTAYSTASRLDGVMHSLPASPLPISAVPWATTPQDNPDPDLSLSRYTTTYQLIVLCR